MFLFLGDDAGALWMEVSELGLAADGDSGAVGA